MRFEIINVKMSLEEYNNLSIEDLNRLANIYCGSIINVILDDETATIVIQAPETWRCILLNKVLLPYRFV